MMKFLCSVAVIAVSCGAFAQAGDLFPELRRRQQQPVSDPVAAVVPEGQAVPSLFEEEDINQAEMAQRVRQEGLNERFRTNESDFDARVNAAKQGQKAEPNKSDKGFFVLAPGRVQIVEPSVSRFQFCMADLTLTNNTEETLQSMQVSIKYGNIDMPFDFGSVPPGEMISRKFYMASAACQGLVQVPQTNVIGCRATNMTDDVCKSKVKYVTRLELTSDTQQ